MTSSEVEGMTTPGATFTAEPILWSADHETGNLSQWTWDQGEDIFITGTGEVTITQDVTHSGRHAAKLMVRTHDGNPAAVRLFRWKESCENPEAYYSIWYYFPQHINVTTWLNIMQWKSSMATRNDPMWVVGV
jgi:hypothetical protein